MKKNEAAAADMHKTRKTLGWVPHYHFKGPGKIGPGWILVGPI